MLSGQYPSGVQIWNIDTYLQGLKFDTLRLYFSGCQFHPLFSYDNTSLCYGAVVSLKSLRL